jgi:photosystem II stability/assembly factor-like uncharacterized protein
MQLINENVGWVIAEGKLLLSVNAGRSWTDISPKPDSGGRVDSAFFLDTSQAWAVLSLLDSAGAERIEIAATTDGAKSWSSLHVSTVDEELAESYSGKAHIAFADGLHGWVNFKLTSSSNFSLGRLVATSDGGRSWIRLPDPPVGDEIRFFSATEGWLAGGPGGDHLYVTHDGGKTWTRQSVAAPPELAEGHAAYDLPVLLTRRFFSSRKDFHAAIEVSWRTVDRSAVRMAVMVLRPVAVS